MRPLAKRSGRRPARARGFTLLELMISLSILAVALTAALGMQLIAIRVGSSASLLQVGSTLLDSYVDELSAKYVNVVKEMTTTSAAVDVVADPIQTVQTLNRAFNVSWT